MTQENNIKKCTGQESLLVRCYRNMSSINEYTLFNGEVFLGVLTTHELKRLVHGKLKKQNPSVYIINKQELINIVTKNKFYNEK